VTAYAGQQAQVTFSTAGGWLLFDDVRFSSVAVPEPSSFALGCIGIVAPVLARTRWSTKSDAANPARVLWFHVRYLWRWVAELVRWT